MSPLQLATILSIAVSLGLVLIEISLQLFLRNNPLAPGRVPVDSVDKAGRHSLMARACRCVADDDKYKVTDDGDMKARAIWLENLHFPAGPPAAQLLRNRRSHETAHGLGRNWTVPNVFRTLQIK
jgi:hypothetical protein